MGHSLISKRNTAFGGLKAAGPTQKTEKKKKINWDDTSSTHEALPAFSEKDKDDSKGGERRQG